MPRFSVDCDFDLTQKLTQKQLQQIKSDLLIHLQNMLPDLTIKSSGTSDFSIRYVAQYGGDKTIKIEISPKIYDNQYEIKQLQGLKIQVMKVEWMFAHKICALISRYQQREIIANRDLYDINFLFQKGSIPYKPIIIERFTKMLGKKVTIEEAISYSIDFLHQHEKFIQKNILDGLGEVVEQKDKKAIQSKLLGDTIHALQSFIKKRKTIHDE